MKYCNTCSTTKDISEFSKDKSRKDGFRSKCKLCVKQYRKENAEKIKAYNKEYKEDHAEEVVAYNKKYREDHPEETAAYNKKYREDNPEKRAATNRKWEQDNPDKRNAITAQRRAAKKERVPKWLNKARKAQITELYAQARKLTAVTGIQFHVDHIVPLQGKNVSGLHIPDNLQILTEHENCSKSNKF